MQARRWCCGICRVFRPASLDGVGFKDSGGRPADPVAREVGTTVAQTTESTVSTVQIGNAKDQILGDAD